MGISFAICNLKLRFILLEFMAEIFALWDSKFLKGSNYRRMTRSNCLRSRIVHRVDCEGFNCAGSDYVGSDCSVPDRTCAKEDIVDTREEEGR